MPRPKATMAYINKTHKLKILGRIFQNFIVKYLIKIGIKRRREKIYKRNEKDFKILILKFELKILCKTSNYLIISLVATSLLSKFH